MLYLLQIKHTKESFTAQAPTRSLVEIIYQRIVRDAGTSVSVE